MNACPTPSAVDDRRRLSARLRLLWLWLQLRLQLWLRLCCGDDRVRRFPRGRSRLSALSSPSRGQPNDTRGTRCDTDKTGEGGRAGIQVSLRKQPVRRGFEGSSVGEECEERLLCGEAELHERRDMAFLDAERSKIVWPCGRCGCCGCGCGKWIRSGRSGVLFSRGGCQTARVGDMDTLLRKR